MSLWMTLPKGWVEKGPSGPRPGPPIPDSLRGRAAPPEVAVPQESVTGVYPARPGLLVPLLCFYGARAAPHGLGAPKG